MSEHKIPSEDTNRERRIHILYLASGNSRRFGENKLLFELGGRPLYCYGLEKLYDLIKNRGDCTLRAVSRYEEVRSFANELGILATDSPESDKGISYTIKAGLYALGDVPEEDYILFAAADQPYISPVSVERLLMQAKQGVEAASLAFGDRPGNPVLFSARLIPELLALEGDTGGRAVLKKHHCVYVQAESEAELSDIDTREDLQQEKEL